MANELKLSGPIVVGSFSSDPATGYNGEVYYNTVSNVFRVYQNGAWATMSTGSVSLTGQPLNNHNIIVGDGSNQSAAVDTSASGDILADSTGALTIKSGVIVNSEINASASIAFSKMQSLTANKALQSDGSGVVSASSVTSTELGYVSGVTSSIQTQLNSKLNTSGGTMSGAINMGSNQINNVSDPTSAQDAATKNYVDGKISGVSWKSPVRALASSSVALTGSAPLTLDGVSLNSGDRVLLTAQTTGSGANVDNGIYDYVVSTGTYTLSRSSDVTSASQLLEAAVFVEEGTTYSDTGWVGTANSPITVGTTALPFVQFTGTGAITAGNGLQKTGNTLSVQASDTSITSAPGGVSVNEDPAGAIITGGSGIKVQLESSNPTLQISSNQLGVKLDAAGALVTGTGGVKVQLEAFNPTLQISSDQLGVKLNPSGALVTSASGVGVQLESSNPTLQISTDQLGVKLDASRAITTGASGVGVNVDNTTIDITSNTLEVKPGGISDTQINSAAAISYSKLAALNGSRVAVTDTTGHITDNTSQDTAIIVNSLQRGKTSTALVVEEYVDSTTLTDNTSSPTSIAALQFAHGTYIGEQIDYVIQTGAGTPDIRMGTLQVVSNGTTTSIIDTFNETADCGVSWTVSISGSNTLLNYTTTSQGTNRTLRADRKLFRK